MGGGGRRGLGERGSSSELVSPSLAAPSFLRGVAEGAGWVGMAVAGLGRGMDCPGQEEGRGVIKAGLQKSEGFCRDAALGKPEGFTPGMGRLRERGLGGGSHPG